MITVIISWRKHCRGTLQCKQIRNRCAEYSAEVISDWHRKRKVFSSWWNVDSHEAALTGGGKPFHDPEFLMQPLGKHGHEWTEHSIICAVSLSYSLQFYLHWTVHNSQTIVPVW